MEDTSIDTCTDVRLATKSPRNFFTTTQCLRVYPYSPETVCLQIRGKSVNTPAIANAYCSVKTLKQLRDWLDGYLQEESAPTRS